MTQTFEMEAYRFGDYSTAFVHCFVHVCHNLETERYNVAATCPREAGTGRKRKRRRRSVPNYDGDELVSAGPFTFQEEMRGT